MKTPKEKKNKSPLEQLPNELIGIIENKLNRHDKAQLAMSCQRFHNYGLADTLSVLFHKPYNTRIRSLRDQVQKLLTYALHGCPKQVQDILKKTLDYYWRKEELLIYQAASLREPSGKWL